MRRGQIKKRFSKRMIVTILEENEAGISMLELSRKIHFGQRTLYAWKSQYAGMSVSELKRLKDFEHENSRFKRMYTVVSMDRDHKGGY